MKLVELRFVERTVPDEDALPPYRTERVLQMRHRNDDNDWTDWEDVPLVKEEE